MAKVCYFTGRKTRSANNRSHAMKKTKRTAKSNPQKVTVLVDGKPKKVWASARAYDADEATYDSKKLFDPRKFLADGIKAVQGAVEERIDVFGSANKA